MRALRDAVSVATAQREYANALGRLAQLRPAVDAFFDQVMVMDEDPKLRANRLALLAQLHGLFRAWRIVAAAWLIGGSSEVTLPRFTAPPGRLRTEAAPGTVGPHASVVPCSSSAR